MMSLSRLGRFGLALAGATVISGPAGAQDLFELNMYTVVQDHPAGYVSGSATHALLGQFSDDAIPDAVVQQGGVLHFLYSIDRRNSWAQLSGDCVSMARRPSALPGLRDEVILSGSLGLFRLAWDGSPSVRSLVRSSLSGTAAWANSTNLQVLPDGAGNHLVAALDSSGVSILRAHWAPGTGTWTPQTSLPVATGTAALVALKWDADPEYEFATAGSAGLIVYDNDGATMTVIAEACSGSLLTAVDVPSNPDRVAWMRSPWPGTEHFSVVRLGGVVDSETYTPDVDVTAMVMAELDGTAGLELMTFSNAAPISIAMRRGTSETFLPWPHRGYWLDLDRMNSPVTVEEDDPGTGVYGSNMTPPVPAVLDLDGDGDDDLFVAGHCGAGEANRALVYFGSVQDQEATLYAPARVRAWIPTYTFLRDAAGAELTFDCPTRPRSGPAATATHVRIVVWGQEEGEDHAQKTPIAPVLCADLDLQNPPELSLSVDDLAPLGEAGKLHIELSYLELDPLGQSMVRALPAFYETLSLANLPLTGFTYTFEDKNFLGGKGTTSGGSTNRPPSEPPSSGGGGTTTP